MMWTTFLLVAVLAVQASAGTICGTVRDVLTQAPVGGAAVFLLDAFGESTGRNTGTAPDGTWCLDEVPAGIYSIVVARDDYQLARVDGVEVSDDATSVSIGARTEVLFAPVFPNPVSDRASFRWRVPEGAGFVLEVFDVRGRRVVGWTGTGGANDTTMVWDLRGLDGRPLTAGTYFAVLRVADVRAVQRIALVR